MPSHPYPYRLRRYSCNDPLAEGKFKLPEVRTYPMVKLSEAEGLMKAQDL